MRERIAGRAAKRMGTEQPEPENPFSPGGPTPGEDRRQDSIRGGSGGDSAKPSPLTGQNAQNAKKKKRRPWEVQRTAPAKYLTDHDKGEDQDE